MKKINLRELYPDVYTTDFLVDVTEEVMETIRAAERVLYYRTRIKKGYSDTEVFGGLSERNERKFHIRLCDC